MRKAILTLLAILAVTSIILAIARISEAGFEGTIGTTFTISGSGFGTKRPHVYVLYANQPVKAKVNNWSDTHIGCLWTKKLPPGLYDLIVKTGGAEPVVVDSLRIMNPEIKSFTPNSASVGGNIAVHGSFFTTKKLKVYIEDPVSLKGIPLKVSNITMDPVTGTSSFQFVMPDFGAGAPTQYNFILQNTIGETVAYFPRSVTTEISGTVSPPIQVPPSSLTVISPFTTSVIGSGGNYTTEVYGEGVAVVAAMPPDKEFGLMNVVAMLPTYDPSTQFTKVGKRIAAAYSVSSSPINLNSMTTAVSMVFVTPYFVTNDPAKAANIIATIEDDPKVQILASVIDAVFGENDPLANPILQEALINAVQSVLDTMSAQAAMVPIMKGISYPAILELPRAEVYGESLGFNTYGADLDYVTIKAQLVPSRYDVCIESRWTGSVDWIAEIMELNGSQFASFLDFQTKASNNRTVYQGEGDLWHDWLSAPAKGFFSYLDIIDKAFDWASEALFGSALKDCATVAANRDGIYLIRAYSGGGWLNAVDNGERIFVITQVPNGDRMNRWALGYNLSTGVFDTLSAFAAFDKFFSEVDINEIALAGLEEAAQKIELVVGNPSPPLRDLISVASEVTKAMLSKLVEVGVQKLYENWYKSLIRSGEIIAESAVNIATLNTSLELGKPADRLLQLLVSATPMETAIVVVGKPFPKPPGRLSLRFEPNPAPKSSSPCNGVTPAWWFTAFVSETAGTGVTILRYTLDFYDGTGNYMSTREHTDVTFANAFDDCGPGSTYIPPYGTACGTNLCAHLGGRTSGYFIMTVYGKDDLGNNVSVSMKEGLSGL